MAKNDHILQVRVPHDLHERAMRRAEAEGTTLSEAVRGWLESYAPEDALSMLEAMFPTADRGAI